MSDNEIEKIDIALFPVENTDFKFSGIDKRIIVKPYIGLNDKVELINEYVDILYGNSSNSGLTLRYLLAENTLIIHTIDVCTNIRVDDMNIDSIINSGMWDEIVSRLPKYYEFRNELNNVLKLFETKIALEKSVGNVLDSLAEKLKDVLDKIPSMDVKELKETSDNFTKELEKLNQTVPGITKTIVRKKRGPRKKEQ